MAMGKRKRRANQVGDLNSCMVVRLCPKKRHFLQEEEIRRRLPGIFFVKTECDTFEFSRLAAAVSPRLKPCSPLTSRDFSNDVQISWIENE